MLLEALIWSASSFDGVRIVPKKVSPSYPLGNQKVLTTAGISSTLLGRTARHIIGNICNIGHITGAKVQRFTE